MPEMACQIFLNAKNARMDEMKSSIRKFLALTKMTRDEFADLCGVSKSQGLINGFLLFLFPVHDNASSSES